MPLHLRFSYSIFISIFLLIFSTVSRDAYAADYFSLLVVRYSDQSVKTFLQGTYDSKARCDQLNQTTWDNVLTACGSCKAEEKFCNSTNELPEMYAKALRREQAAYPYVISTLKGRIIISGVTTDEAVAECQLLAEKFRSNLYSDARCVLP
jgi:Fe-S oxidoreductase